MNVLSIVLQLIGIVLWVIGTAAMVSLLKGCLVLRKLNRDVRIDDRTILLKSPLIPDVALIAVVQDASTESRAFVRRLLDLRFARHEVVVVLNGLSDADLTTWRNEFRLVRSLREAGNALHSNPVRTVYESRDPLRLVAIEKDRAGEDDAWNAGVNATGCPVIGVLDRDSEFDAEILLSAIRPMLEAPEETIAVRGAVTTQSSGSFAGNLHGLEFVRRWLARSAALAGWNVLSPVPGCVTLVRREAIVDAGGFRRGLLELFIRLHARARAAGKPYRVVLVPSAITKVPEARSIRELREETVKDFHQFAGALRSRRISGAGGLLLPAFVWARCARPILETIAFVLLAIGLVFGLVDGFLTGFVLLSTVGLGIVISMASVALQELSEYRGSDPARLTALFVSAIPENLGYRQMRNLWVLKGLFW